MLYPRLPREEGCVMTHANEFVGASTDELGDAGERATVRPPGEPRTAVTRAIGTLFLAGFVTYGVGFALVGSVTSSPDFLAALPGRRATLALGAFLMFLNTGVDVAKAVLFYPILERSSRRTALAYLAAMIVEVVLLTVGVLGLLALIPLSQHSADVAGASPDWAEAVGAVLLQWNAMGYQLGEIALACGAVVLCALLYRTRLLPRFIAVWGLIGYLVLMTGAVAEVFGIHIGVALSIPGGLWEVTLAFWLIVKGFRAQYGGVDASDEPDRAPDPVPVGPSAVEVPQTAGRNA
jgi:hypothetical protein